MVVICFQILSLTTFLQGVVNFRFILNSCDLLSNFIFDNVLTRLLHQIFATHGCDLLSNFIFDNVLTRIYWHRICNGLLWFAFKFYLWQRSYKRAYNYTIQKKLWFAFKFYLWQRSYKMYKDMQSFDLLWFAFKFYLWQRSYKFSSFLHLISLLWFAFKFYLWQRSYKKTIQLPLELAVVICFQILSLTTFLQAGVFTARAKISCDLLSNFIFDNVLTSLTLDDTIVIRLWFAFKFYLWQRSYKPTRRLKRHLRVVICFQILSLTTFLQVAICIWQLRFRCDLLSNFIFDNVLTSMSFINYNKWTLWFAFKFYLWQRSYKQ